MRKFLLLSVSSAVMLAAATANAQTTGAASSAPAAPLGATASSLDTTRLGEVLVTVRKREERLNDVPIAASVVSSVDLQRRGTLTDTQSVLAGVAGLNFNPVGATAEFTIRGSGPALGAAGGDTGVGLYRNGLFAEGGLFYGHNYSRADFFDIQQVEVLRGTQGALYGRDAVGGSVNVVSARPSFTNTGYGNLDYRTTVHKLDAQAVANVKLSDTVAIRFGVDALNQDKGFVYDRTHQDYMDKTRGVVVRGQVRYASGPLDLNLLAERQEDHPPSVQGQTVFTPGTQGFAAGYSVPRFVRDVSLPGISINNLSNVVFNGSYKFDFGTLSVNSGYRDLYIHTRTDVDQLNDASLALAKAIPGNTGIVANGPFDANQNLELRVHTYIYDEEAHLAGGSDRLTWLVGGEYLDLRSRLDSMQTRGAPQVFILNAISREHWKSIALFGSLGYDIVPHVLNLSGEGRYTDDKKDLQRFSIIAPVGFVLAPTSYDQKNFSYDITLGYHFVPQMLAYAKVGTGYRVGGANVVPLVPSPPAPIQLPTLYNDETSIEYELGLKGSPTPQSFVGISAYHTTTANVIVSRGNGCTVAICGRASPNALDNAGTANAWGVELEGKIRTEFGGGHGEAGFTLSRQHGKLTAGPFTGAVAPQNPDWIWSADLDYSHPFVGSSQVFGHLKYHGQSGGLQDVSPAPFRLDARNVTDLRVGVDLNAWELAAYVNNVFDDQFRDNQASGSQNWDVGLRSFGLQLKYRW
jgi:iron complex outermembrane receptor protein